MADWLRLRQVCMVAPALEPAAEDLGAILGLEVCHRDPHVAAFGVANVLFAVGTSFLEIIAPLRDGAAAGRFLARSGGRGGYMAIFDCADPGARQAHAASMGVGTAFAFEEPGVYRCVQLHPRDTRAAMLEFDWNAGGKALTGDYWPAGGDGWQRYIDARTAHGICGIEAVSGDPAGLARHWGAILQRPVEAGNVVRVDNAEIAFRASEDGRERLAAVVLEAADGNAIMAAARARGNATGADSFVLCGVTFRLR